MAALTYLSGFGNEHSTEAVAGALPQGRNSPQRVAFGLYAEQVSGSAFTAPRAENLRSWQYRLRPSAQHAPYRLMKHPLLRTEQCHEMAASPNRLRWNPPPIKQESYKNNRFCQLNAVSPLFTPLPGLNRKRSGEQAWDFNPHGP